MEAPDVDGLPRRPLAVVAAVSGIVFVALAIAIAIHPAPNALDRAIGGRLVPASDESRRFELAADGSDIGSPGAVVVAGVVLATVCWSTTRRWRLTLLCVAAPGLAGALAELALKPMVGRPTIDAHAHTSQIFSFPSGHAAGATALAGAVALVAWVAVRSTARRTIAIAGAVVYAVIVGVAQVVTSAHYATDVFGGVLLGTCVTASVALVLTRFPARVSTRSERARAA